MAASCLVEPTSGYTRVMALSIKKHWGFVAVAVVLLCAVGVAVFVAQHDTDRNTDSTVNNVPTAAAQPVAPTAGAAVATTPVAPVSPAPVPEPVTQSKAQAAETDSLPPISKEVANEIRRLSVQNSKGLVEVKQADGSTSIDLQGHFQSVTAAAIGPDGKLYIRHGEEFLNNVK